MIFVLDEKGIIKEVNNCGAKELGYKVNELHNKPVTKVFLEEDWDTVVNQINECVSESGENVILGNKKNQKKW